MQQPEQSPYTGHVEPGGPSAVRALDRVVIRKASVGGMDNNAYLLSCRRTGDQLLIDAADDEERLLRLVREGSRSSRLNAILTTHAHADHHRALAGLAAVTGAQVLAGAPDADALGAPVTRRLRHGDRVVVGDVTLDVIGLRGHTDGSVALAYSEPVAEPATASASAPTTARTHLFSGDSLFPGGLGNTGRDPQRFARLYADVLVRVFDVYDDETWVYPGHGDDTTLGAERPHLAQWRARGW